MQKNKINSEIKKIADAFQKELNLDFTGNTKQAKTELQGIFTSLREGMQSNDFNVINKAYEDMENFARKYHTEVKLVNEELVQERDLIKSLVREQKVLVSQNDYNDLQSRLGGSKKLTAQTLSSVFGVGNWATNKNKADVGFDIVANNINSALGKIKFDGSQFSDEILRLQELFRKEFDETTEQIHAMGVSEERFYGEIVSNAMTNAYMSVQKLNNEIKQGAAQPIQNASVESLTSDISNLNNVIQQYEQAYQQAFNVGAKDVSSSWIKNSEGAITGFSVSVKKANGELETLKHAIEDNNIIFTGSTGNDNSIANIIGKANTEAVKLLRNIDNIKAKGLDQTITRPIKSEEGIANVEVAYNQAVESVNKLKGANAETFSQLMDESQRAVLNLQNVISAQQRLEAQATKLRTKPFEIIKEEQSEKLQQFISSIAKSAIPNVEKFKEKAAELATTLAGITQGKDSKQQMANFMDEFDILRDKFNAINKSAQTAKSNLNALTQLGNSQVFKQNAGNSDVEAQIRSIQTLSNKYAELLAQSGNFTSEQMSAKLVSLKGEFDSVTTSAKNLQQQLTNERGTATFIAKVDNLKAKMEQFATVNNRAVNSLKQMSNGSTFKDTWTEMTNALNSGNLNGEGLRRITAQMQQFRVEAQTAGLTTSKFFTDMGTQLKNLAMRYMSFYAMIGYIKSMVNSVKELDTAMVNLKRVTDATDIGYSKFKDTAKEVAKEMRVTTGELVEQTYQWAKLGYGMEDALKMAKNTMLLSSVADMGQDDATKTLVTTLKSFRMEADQALTVVDKLDALNNKYATSAQGLSEALVRSASAMSSAGNSLDETLALLTGSGEITQNMEQTGNALRTISLRLRGMKGSIDEVEADVEDVLPVSKVQTQILNLTGSVDIFNKATGEFRSTYEILRDISEVWDDLSGTNRASLTEILFGKNRANVGLALIEAFQSGQIQKAFEDANVKNSAGTATAEFERMGDSIQARMDKLRASFATLSDDIIGSDLVKNGVDFLNLVVTGVDKVGKSLGGLSTIIGTVYAVAVSKGSSTALLSGIMNAVSWLPHVSYEASNSIHALSGRMEEAVKGSKALSIGFGALQGVLITLAVKGVTVLIDKLIVTKAEMQEMTKQLVNDMTELKNATKETTDEISSITDLANEYSKIATTIDDTAQRKAELTQIQNDLNDRYTDESEKIDLINGKYSEQIGLMQEIADKKKEEFAYENADKINTARQLAQTNFGEGNFILNDTGRYSMKSLDLGKDKEDKELADKIESLYKIRDLNREIVEIAKQTDGVRESTRGFFDDKGIYLSGNLENAKKQLEEIINNYKAMAGDDVDQTALKNMSDHYTLLKEALNDIKSVQPFLNDLTENSGLSEKQIQQYNSALDSVQEKLTQLANPKGMPIDQYGKLTDEVSDLKDSLYGLAKGNKDLTEQVDGLFAAYNKGIAEGLTGFEQYVEEAQSILETSYTDTQTVVANVQGAIKNMSEGKGIAGTTALKMLKSDAEGLLKTVKIVNGEYFFGEQELIKYKDENIRKTQEELRANVESSQASLTNLQNKAASHRREIQDIEKEISLIKSLNSISPNDAKALSEKQKRIQTINFQLAETEKDINAINGSIRLNNYVIQELGQNLGNANIQSKAVIDNYETLIKNLETEISTVDKSVDGLNARKDALNEEKDILNDQLDILKEQQKALEDEQKTFKGIVDSELKRVEDSLKEQLDDIEEQTDAIKEQYDERIDKIKDENEQRDLAYNKEKALLELRNASEQMVKTYSSAQGWTYGADKSKVEEAQQKVDKLNVDEQIAQLERERDALLKPLQANKKDLEKRISDFEKYAKQYTDTVEEIQNADGAMLAEQLLGADWREKIAEQDSAILKRYQNEYQSYTDRIDNIKDNEIKSIEDSIKAKENDIKAIENQIKAYNNYKNELQNNLSDAKTALSDYKDSIANATANITDMFDTMARSAWESAYSQADAVRAMGETLNEQQRRLLDYYTSVAEASRDMQDALSESSTGYGIVNSAWDAYLAKHRYATGGVNDYTGMAWLDGTKSAPEVVLNNSDASKLWNLIHNLPTTLPNSFDSNIAEDRIASMNQNSISVNIEKIVADNPTQFVNGLDEALNKYFTTKLTQSYVY